jgi:cyclopropane fatty-acyl-phospholipid synthase-like methyltransferase
VLDFGCGAGRVIRHFAPEAAQAEFVGCDLDGSAIEWATGHLGNISPIKRRQRAPMASYCETSSSHSRRPA